jgi:hypothetical protein
MAATSSLQGRSLRFHLRCGVMSRRWWVDATLMGAWAVDTAWGVDGIHTHTRAWAYLTVRYKIT